MQHRTATLKLRILKIVSGPIIALDRDVSREGREEDGFHDNDIFFQISPAG
jgi:hypothetical protein